MNVLRVLASAVLVLALPSAAGAQSMPGTVQPLQAGFGGAVVIAEGDVLVGEGRNRTRPGMVYVYRQAGGAWSEVGRLTGPAAQMGDGFGRAMATDGSNVLIADGNGAVHVYTKSGTHWSHTGHMASDVEGFGSSVAVSGGVALVGAAGAGLDGEGAVHVFTRTDGGWAESGVVARTDAEANFRFGSTVAIDGDEVLIAAAGANQRTGALYHYRLDGGSMVEVGEVTAQGISPREAFGASIDIDGQTALVGAPFHAGQVGGVFEFQLTEDGSWRQSGYFLPYMAQRRGQYGSAVEIVGDEYWIGAAGQGAVFRLHEDGVEVIRPEMGRSGFGASFAVTGDVAAFGMPVADYGMGQAGIFELNAMGDWVEAARVLSEVEALDPAYGEEIECEGEGQAAHFTCADVDLVSFMPVPDLGGDRGISTNDVWGWTDPETGHEYALVGMTNQASFVDVTDPTMPVLIGTLRMPETARGSTWRDLKVYDDHVFIVSDGAGQHGMQVFDLTRLREFDGEAMEFEHDALYEQIASAHNVVINPASGYAYIVGVNGGGETCGGGLHMVDVRSPLTPTFAGCFAHPNTGRRGTGYTHDAQCVMYEGPDSDYTGREICFSANETALSVADVTDKANTVALSTGTYPNPGYTHQGWLTDDQRYFYINDELDEIQGTTDRTRTMIFDVADLDDPQMVGFFFGTEGSSDHNLYVLGDRMYQSNYQGGLRVVDITDPENPVEVAFFDTVPFGDNTAGFGGSWSNYPFFPSGNIIVTSGSEGLFVVRPRSDRPIF